MLGVSRTKNGIPVQAVEFESKEWEAARQEEAQMTACLRGDHEASEQRALYGQTYCKHCRCLFVGKE